MMTKDQQRIMLDLNQNNLEKIVKQVEDSMDLAAMSGVSKEDYFFSLSGFILQLFLTVVERAYPKIETHDLERILIQNLRKVRQCPSRVSKTS